MKKAMSVSLSQDEDKLIQMLNEDSELIFHVGLQPNKLNKLVKYNHNIAFEVLLKLTHSKQI